MLIVILIAAILTVTEVFLSKKNNNLAWIIPIITGIYLVYSCYKVVRFQDLTYIDMLPSLMFFIPAVVAFFVSKAVIKKWQIPIYLNSRADFFFEKIAIITL